MTPSRNIWREARSWWDRTRSEFWSAAEEYPLYRVFGKTPVLTAEVSVGLWVETIVALQTADEWLSAGVRRTGWVAIVGQSPTRCIWTLTIAGVWLLVFAWMFRDVGWPRWLALPYVLGILCPSTLFFESRLRGLLPELFVLLLQIPVAAVWLRRVHLKTKARD